MGGNVGEGVSQLERELREKRREIQQLQQQLSSSEERQRVEAARHQREVRGKEDTITRLQGEVRGKEDTIIRLQGEAREREAALSSVRDQLAGQRERHMTELQQVRLECQQQLRSLSF